MGQLQRRFVALGSKGLDVARLLKKTRKLETEIGRREVVGRRVGQQSAPLDRARAHLKRERIRAPGEIPLRNFQNAPRRGAESGAGSSAPQTLRLEAEAVRQGVAPGFIHHHHHCFPGIGSLGVLRRNRNTAEYSQIVEFSLRLHDSAFAQRFSRVNSHLA